MVTKDYSFIKKGAKVRWLDPAIMDYDAQEREEVLNQGWEIYDCPAEIEDDTDIVYITCGVIGEGHSEAEVYACELVPFEED